MVKVKAKAKKAPGKREFYFYDKLRGLTPKEFRHILLVLYMQGLINVKSLEDAYKLGQEIFADSV